MGKESIIVMLNLILTKRDSYIKNLDASNYSKYRFKIWPNINTKETIAEFINQQKIIEIQDLHWVDSIKQLTVIIFILQLFYIALSWI